MPVQSGHCARFRAAFPGWARPRPLLLLCALCLELATGAFDQAHAASEHAGAFAWRADHHAHVASVDICERVGDCLERHRPPAVLGSDVILALDEAGVARAVVFSSAYLYGLDSLGLDAASAAVLARRENEFTAIEVKRFAPRLAGFLSVDPLAPWALDEIRHWRDSPELTGLKLHFAVAGVDVHNAAHRDKVTAVLHEAARWRMPLAIHIGGGRFDAEEAEIFIRQLLPAAGESPVQVAHAGGGYPHTEGRHGRVLRAFADHLEHSGAAPDRVWFDLSFVPAPEQDEAAVAELVKAMRRIGLDRFLFGSDFNVLAPAEQIRRLARLGLTDEELGRLRENCAPWACAP